MSDPEGIRILGDLQRLALAPDDIVVLKVPHRLPMEAHERIRTALQKTVGEDRKIMILEDGIEIGVLAPASEE